MTHDYDGAAEWFDFCNTAKQEDFGRYAVKHPQQIKHKEAIAHALKLAKKLQEEPSEGVCMAAHDAQFLAVRTTPAGRGKLIFKRVRDQILREIEE